MLATAGRVMALRKAMPPNFLRFLVPDEGSSTDIDYLSILVSLQEASRGGQDELGHSDLIEASRQTIRAILGDAPDEETLHARIAYLQQNQVIERITETEVHDHFSFRRDYQRYRLSPEGALVIGMLDDVDRRRRRPLSTQDAANLLASIRDTLSKATLQLGESANEGDEGNRRAYLDLQLVAERSYPELLEFLHGLNQQVALFGIGGFTTADLDRLVDGLERYMQGIHEQFEMISSTILSACQQLMEPKVIQSLRLGRALAQAQDQQNPFGPEPVRTSPEDLLARLIAVFDATRRTSLVQEVRKVQLNTRRVVGRLRNHWQKLLDRTNFIQQLNLAWDQLKRMSWEDPRWANAHAWFDQLYELSQIPTAPNLPAEGKGLPPLPQRRHVLVRNEPPMPVMRSSAKLDFRNEEKELGDRLERLVQERILKRQDTALLSDFVVHDHRDFRDILEIAKCSELLLNNGIAQEYFTFRAEYVPKVPRVQWRVGDANYTAPEIRFRRASKKTQTPVTVTHGN